MQSEGKREYGEVLYYLVHHNPLGNINKEQTILPYRKKFIVRWDVLKYLKVSCLNQ